MQRLYVCDHQLLYYLTWLTHLSLTPPLPGCHPEPFQQWGQSWRGDCGRRDTFRLFPGGHRQRWNCRVGAGHRRPNDHAGRRWGSGRDIAPQSSEEKHDVFALQNEPQNRISIKIYDFSFLLMWASVDDLLNTCCMSCHPLTSVTFPGFFEVLKVGKMLNFNGYVLRIRHMLDFQ